MSIDVKIVDGKGSNQQSSIVRRSDLPPGQVVYTEPYRTGIGQVLPFINTTNGIDMNKNGAFGGTPDGVHNGTDSVLWTASALSGSWTFNSTAQAHTGTKSVDATASKDNTEAQFARASAISTGNYAGLTGWIYLTGWSTGNNVRLRFRLSGTTQGVSIDLTDYINVGSLNVWQKFSINLSDFEMGTVNVNQLVVTTVKGAGGDPPNYYLDDIQVEQTGAAIPYELSVPQGSIYYVTNIIFFGVTTIDTTTTNPLNAPNVSYDKFFGENALTTGLSSTTTINGTTTFAGVFVQNADLLLIPYTDFTTGSDGTNTWYRYQTKFDKPVRLDGSKGDNLRFIVNDDLSGMPFFRIFSNGVTEELITGENK